MIIDFHTHIFPPQIINNRSEFVSRDPLFSSLYANPKAKLVTAEELISSMDAAGIATSVIQNIHWSSSELCKETNRYLLEAASRYPQRLIAFCMIPFSSPEAAVKEIEDCTQGGARGVGEIRPSAALWKDNAFWNPIINSLVENKLLLSTHASEPVGHSYAGKGEITPEVLYPFISRYPDLSLVCAHWGGGLPFYASMPEVQKALANVYFDTAASPFLYLSQIYSQVISIIGPEKILFGSDYPLMSPNRVLNEINKLGMPEDTRQRILGQNASQILRITKRG